MKIKSFALAAGIAMLLAVTGFASAQVLLPTGATITPSAAPGSVFAALTTSLPDFPTYTPDGAETTAISPDGKTLLILTSGYNLMENASGNYTGTDSGEFVFVYDITTPGRRWKNRSCSWQTTRRLLMGSCGLRMVPHST